MASPSPRVAPRARWLSLSLPFLLLACGPTAGTAEAPARAPATLHQPILGGAEAPEDEAVFALAERDGSGMRVFCTATLIAPHTLLTAAHCVSPQMVGNLYAISTLAPEAAPVEGFFAALEVRRHPSYSERRIGAFDIALVLLDGAPVQASKPWNHQPMEVRQGQPLRVLGFGLTSASTVEQGETLRRQVGLTLDGVDRTRLFFGTLGTEGVCFGDSGGPTFHTFDDGVERVVGVHSYTTDSRHCGEGADMRVDAYADFVRTWLSEKEAPTCGVDGVCLEGCAEVDLDCICVADGTCSEACPSFTLDPDCQAGCEANLHCMPGCERPDPDCNVDGVECARNTDCHSGLCTEDSQRARWYCSSPCTDSITCAEGMECHEGVCLFPQQPEAGAGEACVPQETLCTGGTTCMRLASGQQCRAACTQDASCSGGQQCLPTVDGQRTCQEPPVRMAAAEQVTMPVAAVGCQGAPGGPLGGALLAALALLWRRRSP